MAIEPPEPNPERDRLTEIIAHCEKRVRRAGEKFRSAGAEQFEAIGALQTAKQRLADWQAANPDPQGSLLEGLSHV